jgi:hypothetical protein
MNRWFAFTLFLAGVLIFTSCQHATPSRSALPFGSVDTPAPKTVVQGQFQIAGWALSEQPIEAVSIYVDRKYLGDGLLRVARPDVAAAHRGYKDASNSGWMTTLEATSFTPGWHELVAQARSQDGATRDLATIPLMVKR